MLLAAGVLAFLALQFAVLPFPVVHGLPALASPLLVFVVVPWLPVPASLVLLAADVLAFLALPFAVLAFLRRLSVLLVPLPFALLSLSHALHCPQVLREQPDGLQLPRAGPSPPMAGPGQSHRCRKFKFVLIGGELIFISGVDLHSIK